MKNRLNRKQYIQKGHHEPIVTREVYNAANMMKSARRYAQSGRSLPVLSVVDAGILRGYAPIDKGWSGFSLEDYQLACESVPIAEMGENEVTQLHTWSIRPGFFSDGGAVPVLIITIKSQPGFSTLSSHLPKFL